MVSRHICGSVAAILLLSAAPLEARDGGSIQGWVEDAQGAPVSGALVSLFGRGLSGGGVVAFTDAGGHVSLPALPAGSYTLRAVGRGLQAGAARQITVLPDQRTFFSLSLTPPRSSKPSAGAEDGAVIVQASAQQREPEEARPTETSVAETARELRWLLRHKRRSTLESLDPATTTVAADLSGPMTPSLSAVGGTFLFVAHAASDGLDETPLSDDMGGLGLVKLQGRLSDNAQWSVGGVLAENQARAWRMAAEFVVETEDGHTFETGSGYGRAALRPTLAGSGAEGAWAGQMGAIFLRDRYRLSERFTSTLGTRVTYYGFLNDRMHVDPQISGEWKTSRSTLVRGTFSARTLTPGGDILTVSTLAAAPALAYALLDPQLRPERITRYELAVSARAGLATFTATAFREGVRDQLVNAFGPAGRGRSLHIVNGRGVSLSGGELSVGANLGKSVTGSLSYAAGYARRGPGGPLQTWFEDPASQGIAHDGSFHDVSARVEAVLQRSDTRLVAYCRLSALDPEGESPSLTRTRFDVQLIQGLPFIGELTRSDWDLLLGLRNLYYEDGEGATLDEWATLKAPKRVVGGISVKF